MGLCHSFHWTAIGIILFKIKHLGVIRITYSARCHSICKNIIFYSTHRKMTLSFIEYLSWLHYRFLNFSVAFCINMWTSAHYPKYIEPILMILPHPSLSFLCSRNSCMQNKSNFYVDSHLSYRSILQAALSMIRIN
jgi:hypothetical protein